MADRVVTKLPSLHLSARSVIVTFPSPYRLSFLRRTSDRSSMWRRCCLDINQSTVFESYQGSPVIQPKYSNTEGPEQPVPAS